MFFFASAAFSQVNSTSVNVISAQDKEQLIGVIVSEKGTSVGTSTDINGVFLSPSADPQY